MSKQTSMSIFCAVTALILSLPTHLLAFAGGDGTPENPYQISTRQHLEAVNNDLAAHYILINDIDLTGTVYTQAVIAPDTDPETGGFQGTEFTGSFDGSYYVIYNFEVDVNNYCGLFSRINTVGSVVNIGLENISVKGLSQVGGLVGVNFGSITNCYSTGAVTGDMEVGGLVGVNSRDGVITNCYSTGSVTGRSLVGGLAGRNDYGSVTNCYSTGSVTGGSSVGGLLGDNRYGSVTNCYSTGSVTGHYYVGGLMGFNYKGIVVNSFWDIQSSGIITTPVGRPKTTSQMMDPLTFAGWNDGNWAIDAGKDYPRLSWENQPGLMIETDYPARSYSGAGTWDDPFVLLNSADILSMSIRVPDWNSSFILGDDIDMSGISGYYPVTEFGGTLDGDGHVIYNLTIDSEVTGFTDTLGLVGFLTGNIKNLGLENISIISTGYWSGSIAACNKKGTIENCYSTGSVSGYWTVGGLVGFNYPGSVIANSYCTGSVSGDEYVGGLVGYNDYFGSVANCYSTGLVTGDENTGGLIGTNKGGSTNCFWDIETSGLETSAGGTGKTTDQMQDINTFLNAGWDFTDIWTIGEGTDYPRFNRQKPIGDFSYPEGVYTEDLLYFAAFWLSDDCDSNNEYCYGTDMNQSGAVDLSDMAIFANVWLQDIQPQEPISNHIFAIEMSMTYDFGRGYGNAEPIEYEFDAWMHVSDTVSRGTIETPTGAVYQAEMEVDDDENWLGIGVGSNSLEGLEDFTDGEYVFTVTYTNGKSQSTSVPYAKEDGSPIPPVDQPLVAEYPQHYSTDIPLNINILLESTDNPELTYGLEWSPVDYNPSALSGEVDDLAYNTISVGPVNLSPQTEYELELSVNHAIWLVNQDGIPYVVDKDAEVAIIFTTGNE
ncbi:Immunoglobulin A1 protease precursor [Limihaloglobus sulfuriphilus]|uniref:Immunoglobulin A1 protease n=2 Tax=Limihaloglobus sulfuriphilus TaxID=1851148 RepID=A0A1Q2MFM9_9BACT|nr:Immunoglobulin A1 protease precursor [Limihaloglobus sulfuriphilus]